MITQSTANYKALLKEFDEDDIKSGLFVQGRMGKKHFKPGIIIGHFEKTHGSHPSYVSERFSNSYYQKEETQRAAELEDAGATLSVGTTAEEFEETRVRWNNALAFVRNSAAASSSAASSSSAELPPAPPAPPPPDLPSARTRKRPMGA